MLHISGGIDRDEYCRNLDEMWTGNADNWDAGTIEGWWIGWNEHCA